MGATFSSGAEVELAPPAAVAPGADDKKLWNDDLVDSYVFVVDAAAELQVLAAERGGGGEEKTLWPELVGRHVVDAAREIVLQDRPEVRVYFYDYCKNAPPPGFDPKRVVLFRDSDNLVVTVPKLG